MPDAAFDMFVLRSAEHPLLLLNKIHMIFLIGWSFFGFLVCSGGKKIFFLKKMKYLLSCELCGYSLSFVFNEISNQNYDEKY